MIRTILTAKEQVLQLVLPQAWIGKAIEVIAFAMEEAPVTSEVKPIGQRDITVIDVDGTNYRFDRDELHER
jgi:hypothetical protein